MFKHSKSKDHFSKYLQTHIHTFQTLYRKFIYDSFSLHIKQSTGTTQQAHSVVNNII